MNTQRSSQDSVVCMAPAVRMAVIGGVLAVLLFSLLAHGVARAAPLAQAVCTMTVTSTADDGAGSLRQALATAGAGDVICFDASLGGQTITLASEIVIGADVTISGTIPITVDGNHATRLFSVNPATNVMLYGLTLRNGSSGGLEGGAIRNRGVLTVSNSTLQDNSSADNGGAIFNYTGVLTVIASQFFSNTAGGSGGAIYNHTAALTVADSTFVSNTAAGSGGGINVNSGTATVAQSTFRGNAASAGGAIDNVGVLVVSASSFGNNISEQGGGGIMNGSVMTLTASTVSGNAVTGAYFVGGGIYNASGVTMHISQVTVSDNSADQGGGIYNAGEATIIGSVLSANSGGNCFDQGTAFDSGGYNVSSDATCSTKLTGTNDRNDAGAQTQPLQANGAAPLRADSVAINNVTDADLCTGTDQLGHTRLPAPCESGAVEYYYTLTVAASGTGSGVMTPTVGAHTYPSGTLVAVLATPAADSTFTQWSGACTGSATCNIPMTADRAVTATFTLITYTVTPSAGPNGSISPSAAQTVIHGSTVQFTVTPNTGYHIAAVTGCGGTLSGNTFTTGAITANCTVSASFAISTYVITPTAGANGSITPATAQTVNHGGTQVFTIAPDTGYHIQAVAVDGAPVGAVSVYTFTNVTANHTITAAFAINRYALTTATAGTGSGTITLNPAGGTYDHGTVVTATPNAAPNASFTGWNGACTGMGDCIVTMTATKVVTAAFTLKTYVITPTVVGLGGSITPNMPQTVNYGGTQAFTIAANPGYRIADVGVDGVAQGAIASYTFANVMANHTISATFACGGVITVQNTADSGAGSLRQAVTDACPGATVTFAPGLTRQTITFGSQIVLNKNLNISSTVPITLSGNNATRIFEVSADANVTMVGLTLRGGSADKGGAINNYGTLTIYNSIFEGNTGGGEGGAIRSSGTLTVNSSIFRSNAAGNGGSILNDGVLTVGYTTFTANAATWSRGMGGAILTGAAMTVNHSTFSANSAYFGGAIENSGRATLTTSTFTGNTANSGGVIHNNVTGASTFSASVFSANTGGSCLGDGEASGGYNVVSDNSCDFAGRNDITNVPAQTLPVQPNGLAPLLASSLAINNVTDPALCAVTDQLGNPRPFPCAAGALEFITAATTRYVATTGSDAGNNTCLNAGSPCATLARALGQAVDGNTIRVITGTHLVASQPISKSVLILGAGSGQTFLQASATAAKHGNGRVLGVAPGRNVTLAGLTVRHGWSSGANAYGGGIANAGVLTVRDSAILSNTVENGGGGAIYNVVDDSTPGSGVLVLYNSTLAGNRVFPASAPAGGAATAGVLPGVAGLLGFATVLGMTWNAGRKRPGRAWLRRLPPLLVGMLFLSNCTCAADPQGLGGALFNGREATAILRFATLAYNRAESGGGIYSVPAMDTGAITLPAAVTTLNASVLSQNSGGDCAGQPVTSLGQNVAADKSCVLGGAGDVNDAGDQVMPVRANGSAPLLASSAAIDRVAAACPTADQVGGVRPALCDAGAAEFAGTAQARLQIILRGSPERPYLGQTVIFTATVLSNGAADAATVSVNPAIPSGLAFQSLTQAGGPACTVTVDSAVCPALARGSQVTLVVRATVATAEVEMQLNTTVTAQAADSAQASAAFLVITRAVPPPSVGCGGDYATIQAAVDAVPTGSTIEVCPGTYRENVIIDKNLTIRSRSGAATTTVDGNQAGRVFDIRTGSVVTLGGLTIRNGFLSGQASMGAGIHSFGTLIVTDCIISGNRAGFGGGIFNVGTLTVNNSAISNNRAGYGSGIANAGQLTVNNSIISNNVPIEGLWSGSGIHSSVSPVTIRNSTITGNGSGLSGDSGIVGNTIMLTINSSIVWGNFPTGIAIATHGAMPKTISQNVLQDSQPTGNGNKVSVPNAGFVDSQQGNLHLNADSPAVGMGVGCPATDLEGKTRAQPDGCSAGAYEFSTVTAGGGLAQARLEPLATATVHTFTSVEGAVTLDIPAEAVTQTVELAFNLGQPTGGDGRAQGVRFTPYDAAGQPLGADFAFLQPLLLSLEYDPALVTHGLEVDLLPRRFEQAAGLWLPFTADVVVDKVARTVTFPIRQVGEYGLFSAPPAADVAIAAAGPAGVVNVDGGSTLRYTLAALNASSQPQANVLLRHVLPAGVTFVNWVDDGSAAGSGAVYAGGVITWTLPSLAGGGLRYASFDAQISADAAFWGQVITSTVTLTGSAGLALSDQAVVSVNGPTTPVTDSVTTRPGEAVMLWPLVNDINPDGSPLALTALGAPGHGVATILGDTVLYTPTAGFVGNDSFAYMVQDGQFSAQGLIQVRVARLAFLNVLKTVAYAGQASIILQDVPRGSQVVYTLDLFNGSDGEVAASAVLTDVLPAGVTFSGWITQAGATRNGNTITWNAASVPTATVTAISYRAIVTGAVGSAVANSVQAAAANADLTQASASVVLADAAPPPVYLPLIQRNAGSAARVEGGTEPLTEGNDGGAEGNEGSTELLNELDEGGADGNEIGTELLNELDDGGTEPLNLHLPLVQQGAAAPLTQDAAPDTPETPVLPDIAPVAPEATPTPLPAAP